MDLLICNAKLPGKAGTMDLAIKDGKIAQKSPSLQIKAAETIDADGRLVIPGFVDAHTHLEKVLTLEGTESCSLGEAIEIFKSRYSRLTHQDIVDRATRVVEMAIRNGTIALRTHISTDAKIGLMAVEAILDVKEKFKDLIDIQIVAMATIEGETLSGRSLEVLDEAIKSGVDLVGGAPHLTVNPKEFIDASFEVAKKYDVPVDFHIDESDLPNVDTLEYLAEKVRQEGYQGRATAGHCTALSAVGDELAERVMAEVKEAEINIVTLPSCNLYLMGRKDKHPQRRGLTRVREFLELGVNVAYASDNIQDPFRPFGNADMLEEALITSQALQMGSTKELETVLEMGTYRAAKVLGLNNYGLDFGNQADLVVLEAGSPAEAIVTQAVKAFVIKKGKIIAKTSKTTEDLWEK